MKLLAVETSCDETSAAVVRDGYVISNVVSSQIKMHSVYGGVVPELAAREHLRNLMPVIEGALEEAGVEARELDAVAATQGPGLPSALRAGFGMAQGFAYALDVPFHGINHHEAHLYSPWIAGDPPTADFASMPSNISLIVSGGHTMIVHVKKPLEHEILGGTVDDAAGECFDKTAKLIGLPYPGGPEMDRLAADGDPTRYQFPRPMLKDPNFDFSFSGLKTAVRYYLEKHPEILEDGQTTRDLCASVQEAIVDVLTKKVMRAVRKMEVNCVTASGGVTCNSGLRKSLERECEKRGLTLRLAMPKLCTDNAAMIGILAYHKVLGGAQATSYEEEARPGWALA
ncbi:tRNA (adenosine(37)-N6)-threonylcarbamoyltransferase complex transferase subunit TsaD [Verrucomicrobia bacterium]|nr:tRNA (adenosine(37)-N6)-threonylcarbamoyltransferase complex transferase subunit TsaD [Verrucomicrobiota bacterium]